MALKKISRSYGSAYAFATAVLRTQDGTSRAKVYANPPSIGAYDAVSFFRKTA